MSPSDVLRVKMTVQQFAQLRDQLALGLVRKREPHGWGKIHWVPVQVLRCQEEIIV